MLPLDLSLLVQFVVILTMVSSQLESVLVLLALWRLLDVRLVLTMMEFNVMAVVLDLNFLEINAAILPVDNSQMELEGVTPARILFLDAKTVLSMVDKQVVKSVVLDMLFLEMFVVIPLQDLSLMAMVAALDVLKDVWPVVLLQLVIHVMSTMDISKLGFSVVIQMPDRSQQKSLEFRFVHNVD
jgi:hypothetical protein